MCGRYAIAYSSDELPSLFERCQLDVSPQIGDNEHHERSYNVAPTTNGAVYRAKDHELRYMKWGLVPHWTKNAEDFKTYRTFNARLENLQESRMWIQCCNNKRCVVPISGYYEWKTKGKSKIPYYVTRKDGGLMFLAGMYDHLEANDLWSYTIITGKAPKELAWLHYRMPVVIVPGTKAWNCWMDPDKTEWTQEELDDTLSAYYDDKILQVYQVSEGVNKVANNNPSLIKPIYKEDRDKVNLKHEDLPDKMDVKKEHAYEDQESQIKKERANNQGEKSKDGKVSRTRKEESPSSGDNETIGKRVKKEESVSTNFEKPMDESTQKKDSAKEKDSSGVSPQRKRKRNVVDMLSSGGNGKKKRCK